MYCYVMNSASISDPIATSLPDLLEIDIFYGIPFENKG